MISTITTDDGQEWVTILPDLIDEEPPSDPEALDHQQIEALNTEWRQIAALESGSLLLEDREAIRARLIRKVEIERELLVIKVSRRARRERLATIGARAAEIERRRERIAYLEGELPRAIKLDADTTIVQPQHPRAQTIRKRIELHRAEIERLEAGGELLHSLVDVTAPALGTPRR